MHQWESALHTSAVQCTWGCTWGAIWGAGTVTLKADNGRTGPEHNGTHEGEHTRWSPLFLRRHAWDTHVHTSLPGCHSGRHRAPPAISHTGPENRAPFLFQFFPGTPPPPPARPLCVTGVPIDRRRLPANCRRLAVNRRWCQLPSAETQKLEAFFCFLLCGGSPCLAIPIPP